MSAKLLKFQPRSVGVWIRVSTEFQAQGDSPEHHEARAREFAATKEWEVVEAYHLEAVSGKSVINHPEAQRMLADVRAGRISTLIVSKFARLVRNTRELLEFVDIFTENKAEIISLDEPINITTSSGRLLLSVMGSLAEWEREEISARVVASLPIRAKLGKSLGGAAPFGYQWKDRRLAVDPQEAPIRKLLYELFIQHKKKKKVARLLNEAGHRTRRGVKFSDTTVGILIRDPTAKGLRRANYTKVGPTTTTVFKPKSEWVFTQVEPIVSEKLWEEANRILDVQRQKLRRPSKSVTQLFSGKVKCDCGFQWNMYKPSAMAKYVCQGCRNNISITDMEQLFLGALRSLFTSSKVQLLIERAENDLHSKRTRAQALTDQLSVMCSESDKCYRAYVSGHLDEKDFGKFYSPVKLKIKRLESELAELQGEISAVQSRCSTTHVLTTAHQIMEKWWPTALFEEKVELIGNFVKKVWVRQETVAIQFHFLTSLTIAGHFDFGIFALLSGLEVTLQKNPQGAEIVDTLESLRRQLKTLASATA